MGSCARFVAISFFTAIDDQPPTWVHEAKRPNSRALCDVYFLRAVVGFVSPFFPYYAPKRAKCDEVAERTL